MPKSSYNLTLCKNLFVDGMIEISRRDITKNELSQYYKR
ncbi:unknown [Acinetobacter sp. CAG:196]|nr:unknown [Acinetobacter sp. CAG:196]